MGTPSIEQSRSWFARAWKLAGDVRRRLPPWTPQVAGYAISAVCLVWVLHNYPIRDLIPAIRALDWKWVFLAVALDLLVYVCHGWRWVLLLRPVERLPLWRTVQAIYIGLFANEVLPLRVGELIRGYLLAHWNDMAFSVVLASEAIERIIDGIWMIVTFIIAAHALTLPGWLQDSVRLVEFAVGLGVVLLIYVMVRKEHAHAMVKESRWAAGLRHVVEGVHTMGNRGTMGRVVPVSLLYLLLQALSYWALMKAYLLDLSPWDAVAVLAIVRLGTAIPNAPGNIGTLNAACVFALRTFGIEENPAKTFSFVLLFALTLPLIIGGAIATALTGLNLGEIHHHARHHFRQGQIRPPEDLE